MHCCESEKKCQWEGKGKQAWQPEAMRMVVDLALEIRIDRNSGTKREIHPAAEKIFTENDSHKRKQRMIPKECKRLAVRPTPSAHAARCVIQSGCIILMILGLCLSPNIAWADGGAPLLLIINWLAFLYGFIFIVVIESVIYSRLCKASLTRSLLNMTLVNLVSTCLIGLGLPFLVGFLSMSIGSASGGRADLVLAFGTWFRGPSRYSGVMLWATVFWFLVTYLATIYFEAWQIAWQWKRRSFKSPVSARKLSWIVNSSTYFLIALFTLLTWWGELG